MLNGVFYATMALITHSNKTPIVSPVLISYLFLAIIRLYELKLIFQSKKRMEMYKLIYRKVSPA